MRYIKRAVGFHKLLLQGPFCDLNVLKLPPARP